MHLVIHFYLVEEADVVIVFIDRDLEQSLPLQKRHFREPIKIRGRRNAEEEVLGEDLVHWC